MTNRKFVWSDINLEFKQIRILNNFQPDANLTITQVDKLVTLEFLDRDVQVADFNAYLIENGLPVFDGGKPPGLLDSVLALFK